MNTVIRTLPQVQQAQADAWVYGAIVVVIALAIAILIANVINWRSDRKDYICLLYTSYLCATTELYGKTSCSFGYYRTTMITAPRGYQLTLPSIFRKVFLVHITLL